MTTTDRPSPAAQAAEAALETLADMFSRRDYITVLVMRAGRPPGLTVAIRHGWRAEAIYACDGWYWRACAERIAPISDPAAAAATIASALGASPHTRLERITGGQP
jgi:hypothetical protein